MNRHQRAVDTNKSVKIGEELTRFVFSLCYALCVSLLCQKIKKEGTLMARSLMNIRRIITFANRLTVFHIMRNTRVCKFQKAYNVI